MSNTTFTLTASAFKMFVRNKQSLFFALFMPLMIMVIFGFIGFDKMSATKLGIVSPEPTPATQTFIDQFKNAPNISLSFGTEQEMRDALLRNDLAAVFVIPDNLIPTPSPSSAMPETQMVTVLENVGQLQQAKIAETIMSQILDKTTIAMVQAPQFFELKTEEVSVRSTKYIDFLIPGILGLSLMQMAVFGVAFVFADYKEKGILKRLLATPMKPFQFVSSQVITRLAIALAQSAILIAVAILLLHTHVYGSWFLIGLIAILGSVMFLGLGFAISGVANNVDSVPAIANVIVFPMMFLGGTFFPTDGMPNWLQSVVHYLPLQFLTHSLREVMANGASLLAVRYDLVWMSVWAVVLVGLAMFTFRFEEKKI